MKKYSIVFISLSLLLLSSIASTASCFSCIDNWYIAGSGSIAWHNNQRFTFNMRGEDYYFSRNYKRCYGGNVSIGHIIRGLDCVDIRVEGEFLYRSHELYKGVYHVRGHKHKSFSETYSLHGHSKDSAAMANLIADLPFPFGCNLNFYFGLGLGASYNRLSMKPSADFKVVKPPFSRNSWLVAGQMLAGLSYKFSNCTVLTLGYRLFSTGEVLTERNLLRSSNRPYIQSIDLGIRFQR